MKALAFFLPFCAAAHGALTTTTNVVGDITTKISIRTGEEGLPLRRSETSYRGKTKIMEILHVQYKGQKKALTCYSYYIKGKLAWAEDDEDGKITGVSVLLPGTDDFETFWPQPDGSVKPLANKAIAVAKQEAANSYYDSLAKTLIQSNTSEDISKVLEETRSKISDLDKKDLDTTNITTGITTKIEERPGKDGKPDLRAESYYRGKEKILAILSRSNKQGKMAVWSRTYRVDGKSIAIESDNDGDGIFEDLILHSADSDDIEIFHRHTDGTVIPASTEEIEQVKKADAIVGESMQKLIDNPQMSDQEISKTIEEGRQRIQELIKTNGTQ